MQLTRPTPEPSALGAAERLTRKNRLCNMFSPIHRISVYLLDDHLVVVQNRFYTLTLRRFFYKDISSVIASRGRFRPEPFIVWGLIVGIGVIMKSPWVAALGGALALVNFALRPKNALEIRTPHSVELIAPAMRNRHIRPALEAIAGRVAEAQAGLQPAAGPDSAVAAVEPARLFADPDVAKIKTFQPRDLTRLRAVLALTAIPSAVPAALGTSYPKLMIVMPLIFSLTLFTCLYALILINRIPFVSKLIKGLAWYAMASVSISMVICVGYYFAGSIQAAQEQSDRVFQSYVRILTEMARFETFPIAMHYLSINLAAALMFSLGAVFTGLRRAEPS